MARLNPVSFEKSAATAISLLVAASFALQSMVIAHGHVAGNAAGQAEAALAIDDVAVAAMSTQPASRPPVHGVSTGTAMLGLGVGLRRNVESMPPPPAATTAEATADVAGIGLRTDTFGPDVNRTPARIRTAMLGPVSLGNAAAPDRPTAHAGAGQEVIVIRPGGPRTLNLSNGQRAAPKPVASASAPRILGKASPADVGQLVDKVHFQPHTPERCLPHDLLDVVYDIAEKFGEVQILSTFRDPDRNRRVGGAEQSFHLSCQAIDFRVTGGTQAGLLGYLESRPEVGGLKRYPLGYFHIDNGPRRSW